MNEVLKSQTGSGISKRVVAAVAAVLALAVMALVVMGKGEASAEVTAQTPAISTAVTKMIEAILMFISAFMAIWSKYQDRR
jgi:hypothetical protein